MTAPFNREELARQLKGILEFDFRVSPAEASAVQIYKALSKIIVEHMKKKRHDFMRRKNSLGSKQVYYISMEFLMGRSLKTNLYNLGLNNVVEQVLTEEYNIKIDKIYGEEPDAGLGNGGLGRLAACYMDALATCEYAATGYSILYEYGIFKQKLNNGWQTELPDEWLPGGGVWLQAEPDQAVEVHFEGHIVEHWDNEYHRIEHVGYQTVLAVPYDMYVSGYDSKGISKLRLWAAKPVAAFSMQDFNQGKFTQALDAGNIAHTIAKVLYPNDNFNEGKALRLKQQYFMCAASVADIVMRHMKIYGSLDNFHEKSAIHINDTHPTLAIPELMRILLDECGYSWNKSWHICQNTFAYTNHTVMAEALEAWDKDLLQRILPRIFTIICEINRRYCQGLENRMTDQSKIDRMSIVTPTKIRMANLCLDAAHSVNGVSRLHSEIIKESVFKEQYEDKPIKFKNVTNGIAYRRWLLQSNPKLTNLLSETIGDGFKKNGAQLERFRVFERDQVVLGKLGEIKRDNKEKFAKWVKKKYNVSLNLDSIFDVQVKRLHEYKRQQLNVMNILADYLALLENPDMEFKPKTYIFASKAAPGYFLAKQIIMLIWSLSQEIEKNPKIAEKLRVIFLEDYSVTLSELLMPAAEVSEQISLAGTEASGTGNMKLMLNGAITLGTYDGANVEIHEHVGDDNVFVFGMSTPEVNVMKANGYHPEGYYNQNPIINSVINRIYHGVNGVTFQELGDALKFKDAYMCFADFESYRAAQRKISETYANPLQWNRMSLVNIAEAGVFSADRAVTEYAQQIWNLSNQ
ncbi:MAG: glycogen/starch/alpha-glucan family phosphorylase [Oscillospiraceae bacterium]|jgi:starch phosphorylase|nr:glycogen/starch/alpha-glucan family phosphorylase [Oscillospiraceae bacterium]